jgi:hypothetical protein
LGKAYSDFLHGKDGNGLNRDQAPLNGTFKVPGSHLTVDASSPASGVASGDFNNDGNVGLAFAVRKTNKLVIYLGNGDGTFKAPHTVCGLCLRAMKFS